VFIFFNIGIEAGIDVEFWKHETQTLERVGEVLSSRVIEHMDSTGRIVNKTEAELYAIKKSMCVFIFMLSIQFLVIYEVKVSGKKLSREIADGADSTNKIMFNLFKRIGGGRDER